MRSWAAALIVVKILYGGLVIAVNKYDFGLIENEPLLRDLHREDLQLSSLLEEVNKDLQSNAISTFLSKEKIPDTADFTRHPINVFHLIKKHTLVFSSLLKMVRNDTVRDKISELRNGTELIKTLIHDDLQRSMNALAVMIHSYDLDVDILARGEIPANKYGNGDRPLKSFRGLSVHDLGNIATTAMNHYGYLGTASVILKTALSLPRDHPDQQFEKDLMRIVRDTRKLHNGYLEKHKSVFTDSFSFRPYLLDEKLKKLKKQPKFIKSGDSTNVYKIWESLLYDDAVYARQSYMLQSCGGFKVTNHQLFSEQLMRNLDWKTPEIENHKCILVHHKDPFTQLGPFKIEMAYNSPVIMIIHELFTEEDTDYLVDWATPRLSRTRQISLKEDDGRTPKNEWMYRKTTRTVHKSVQAWLNDKKYEDMERYNKNFTIREHRPIRISERIERAVGMNLTDKWASVPYQITSYGLGGLCEDHNDPYGYNEGKELTPERENLVHSGDIFGTVMGWLSDTEAGGATTFFTNDKPLLLWPKKGDAAFWFGLKSDGTRDNVAYHGGCPVIAGSKWIVNKWIYSFDQFRNLPCRRQRGVRLEPWDKSRYF